MAAASLWFGFLDGPQCLKPSRLILGPLREQEGNRQFAAQLALFQVQDLQLVNACVAKGFSGCSNETGQDEEEEHPSQQLALRISTHNPCSDASTQTRTPIISEPSSDARRIKKCASVNLKRVNCSATGYCWSEVRKSRCFARRDRSLVRGSYVSVPGLVRPL